MKTIEQVKQEFKAATGYNMPIYTYDGKLGVLYDYYDEKHHVAYDKFFPMEEFLAMDNIDYDSVRWVTVGADGCEEGEEITDAAVRNYENDEKLFVDCAWSPVDYNKSDEFVRELLVTTTQYYSWTSERKHMIEAIQQDLQKHEEELSYYEGIADDELDDDEKKERDEWIKSLQGRIKMDKESWEKTCENYEDPLDWRDYEKHTIDFENVFQEAVDSGYILSSITKKAAMEVVKDEEK